MKNLFTIFLLLISIGIVSAQDKAIADVNAVKSDTSYWLKSIEGTFALNQASFSGNWTGGGVNSIAFSAGMLGRANYAKGNWSWDNTLDLLYGVIKNQDQDERKSNDRIFLDSKVGLKASEKWNYFFSGNFLSQFAPGYTFTDTDRTLISKFANPAFLTFALGMEYKPNEEFSLRMAPFSPRFTFVTDKELYRNVPLNYGVPIGQTVRTEWLAFSLLADWNKQLSENISFKARYQMYVNYETLAFNAIDHRLDLILAAKVSNAISVTLTALTIYDLDQDDKIQFSQGLGIGLVYKRGNFPE
ncbi:MAG: DUF3078 domain-containing protein [Algoriphagus sp.]|uniref:DUF3078 domain-containing protein n=1 Tax=Algoriphagus sp. TaxID=1872435 RepID=UPI002730D851|nr:DUF3078 domain-containing protein [Algoriphagus sp.]MDP2043062.1 DUF3078 domain-containing protein [Algoriphagus sp.]MDP3473178.1 DUF3078 domain-containing protein [Algoriphagus sp.]